MTTKKASFFAPSNTRVAATRKVSEAERVTTADGGNRAKYRKPLATDSHG